MSYFKPTDKGKKYFDNSKTQAVISTAIRTPNFKKEETEYRKSTNKVITKRYVVK